MIVASALSSHLPRGEGAPLSPAAPARRRAQRGQGLTEFALIFPILLVLVSVIIEGGLAINAWLRVQTAARDGARFALDAGRPDDVATLVLNKLTGLDQSQVNVYIIKGSTNSSGLIPASNWTVDHRYGADPAGPRVQRGTIETGLGGASNSSSRNIPFVVLEVDYVYQPSFLRLIIGNVNIPMTSYALIQQY